MHSKYLMSSDNDHDEIIVEYLNCDEIAKHPIFIEFSKKSEYFQKRYRISEDENRGRENGKCNFSIVNVLVLFFAFLFLLIGKLIFFPSNFECFSRKEIH